MVSTTANFWRMVLQHKCAVIVMLSDCTELGEVGNTDHTLYSCWNLSPLPLAIFRRRAVPIGLPL